MEIENRCWLLGAAGQGEIGRLLVKGYKLLVIKRVSSGDVVHGVVIVINNTILCI